MSEQVREKASGFVVMPRLPFEHLRDHLIFQYVIDQAAYRATPNLSIGQAKIILSQIERETGWTRQMLQTTLKRLAAENHITYETLPRKRGILLTVTHYSSYQNLKNYMPKQPHDNAQPHQQEANAQIPHDTRDHSIQTHPPVHENTKENDQPFNLTAPNNNETRKDSLTSTAAIKTFIEETNPFQETISKKLLTTYFDTIRLTRRTGKISASVLTILIEQLGTFSPNQLHYALWTHVEHYPNKKEPYTFGILRNTSEDEAKTGLLKLKKKTGGEHHAAHLDRNDDYDFGF